MSSVMPEVKLLPIGAAMHALIAEMHRRCFDDGWTAYTVGQVMRMAGAFGYLALKGEGPEETPIGFALASGTLDEWELLSIAVLPEHRRGGAARRLMDAIIIGARAQRGEKLFLEVAEDNAAARRLYETYGFAQIGRRPGYYKRGAAPAMAALTMRRDLI
ncbi:MAG TPA: GNAT family N-acetyltransferase [Alphaproteobacteria bacterium]|nr:GNAT family N-acetyltransferase [Alphaproteobacteria bacterium]